ncbi:hypothetical protein [Wolbachia endosymbiont of Dirofilaria (Dirofilaria) immitis]|uniref:hypothetical protein n=1 Tax=Wolbachia endosymbiont of Dirofilaria (Dirofilaria) immitis TaxID=1812115 RepID=UPI00158B1DD6|nr:hypothetical protein [Wolbachia endosymbiont of Dirofilaria (Dirofilaria) immitis]QKX02286.1 hypothetical protein GOY12_01775 [Wolbachia endosymbiont of Dirofilaria (Dirofilaria) immitis]
MNEQFKKSEEAEDLSVKIIEERGTKGYDGSRKVEKGHSRLCMYRDILPKLLSTKSKNLKYSPENRLQKGFCLLNQQE